MSAAENIVVGVKEKITPPLSAIEAAVMREALDEH
jgi:hypothetical protein